MSTDRATLNAVRAATAREHGSLFRRTAAHPVGGLRGAGSHGELWLVASSNGLGLFDAKSGDRLARDRGELPKGYPRRTPGIGALKGRQVAVAGIDGGSLPQTSSDGWRITLDERAGLWLTAPDGTIEVLRVSVHGEARALGFSTTGGSFVVADGATFVTFAR